MNKDTARFIDRIQKIKSKLRLNYKEIAKTSGLQVSLVTRIFNGHQEPKLSRSCRDRKSIRYNDELLGKSRRH